MRALQTFEIDYVAGGKTTEPRKSWWDRMGEWMRGESPPPSSPATITGAELGQLQRDCLAAGGTVRITQTTGSGGATFRMLGADGKATYLTYSCTPE